MKRSIAAVAAALSTVFAVAAPALADANPDQHMPNPQTGYCPGGRGIKPVHAIYCNGIPYADGSYWRYVMFAVSIYMPGMDPQQRASYGLHCVTSDELVNSSLAPPGGCDSAV